MLASLRPLLGAMVLAFAVAASSGGNAKEPILVTGGMSWLLHAAPITVGAKTASVRMGDFIFVQPMGAAAEAVPNAGQLGVMPGIFGKGKPVALEGRRFASTAGGVEGTTYCTIEDNITSRGQRLCLIDVNGDDRFDFQGRAFGLGNGAPYARMLMAANVLPASIEYVVRNGGPDSLMYAGLVIRKEGESYALKFAVSDKGKPKILEAFEPEHRFLQQQRAKVTTAEFSVTKLPVRVELYGAVVEIVALAGNQITYRLLSGFNPSEPITVSHAGRLPIPR